MITKEDVERLTKYTRENGYSLCFHCEKKIFPVDYHMRISLCRNDHTISYEKTDILLFKYINFHIECWKEIAGEEYCFSEEN